jgi:hypothetical protein
LHSVQLSLSGPCALCPVLVLLEPQSCTTNINYISANGPSQHSRQTEGGGLSWGGGVACRFFLRGGICEYPAPSSDTPCMCRGPYISHITYYHIISHAAALPVRYAACVHVYMGSSCSSVGTLPNTYAACIGCMGQLILEYGSCST